MLIPICFKACQPEDCANDGICFLDDFGQPACNCTLEYTGRYCMENDGNSYATKLIKKYSTEELKGLKYWR